MTTNAQSIRDRFEEKSIHLKELIDKRNKRTACVECCIGCICLPCILFAECLTCIFGSKKKEDVLLDQFK